MALEGLKLKPIKQKPKKVEVETKKFNFNTSKRANGSVRTIPWLEDKSVDEIADLWKLGHVARNMTPEELEKFKDIKYYLKSKYGLENMK